MTEIKLTQFSHGAGCGCKIAPAVLDSILQSSKINIENDPRLLVGHDKKMMPLFLTLEMDEPLFQRQIFLCPLLMTPSILEGLHL